MSTDMQQIAGLFNDCIEAIRDEKHDNLEQMAIDWLKGGRIRLMRSIEAEYEIMMLYPKSWCSFIHLFAGTTSSLLPEGILLDRKVGLLTHATHFSSLSMASRQSYDRIHQPYEAISRSSWILADLIRQFLPFRPQGVTSSQ